MNKKIKMILPIILLTLIVIPVFVFAQGIKLPDCGPQNNCGYAQLIELVQNVINWIILVAVPVSAGVFAWVGFKYMTTGVADQKAAAKTMLWKVFMGLVFILAAWLIVSTITRALLKTSPL